MSYRGNDYNDMPVGIDPRIILMCGFFIYLHEH